MSDDLKPCPFCGADPVMVPWHGGRPTKKCVYCDNDDCHVVPSVTGETRRKAVDKWNSRPIEDALRAENERLRADAQALLPAARLGIVALAAGHDMAVTLGLLEQIPGTHPSKARTWGEHRSCYRDTQAAISARAALAALDEKEAK